MNPRILFIEDEEGVRFGFSRYLLKNGYKVEEAACLSEARDLVSTQRFDAILLDLNLPDGSGLDWIIELRQQHSDIPLIIISGYGDIPVAVEAMRRGADNFLTKPVNMADLDIFLRKSLELGTLRRRYLTSQRLQGKKRTYFGESEAMKKVLDIAALTAKTDSPVLLSGETGSGKGVLARWLHENSLRRPAPFVEVNCSNLKGDLLASELFGHAKGAFTTAVQDRQGLVEVADGGTLFLDEVGDMDLGVQAQLLKVIEDGLYRRLGEVKVRKSEFRLICATNQDLLEEIQQNTFRRDLYFRINVLSIHIPPLRSRTEDLPGLAEHILENLGLPDTDISAGMMKMLQSYSWPGNIRELRNVLERAILLARGKPLAAEHFLGLNESDIFASHENEADLEDLEYAHIKKVIGHHSGDIRKAAEALRISRATLYRKLNRYHKRKPD